MLSHDRGAEAKPRPCTAELSGRIWNSTAISSAAGSWDSSKVRVPLCKECCGIRRCQQCPTAGSALGALGEARAAPRVCGGVVVRPKRGHSPVCNQTECPSPSALGENHPGGQNLVSESPSEGGCCSDAELPSKEASLASRNKRTVDAIPRQRPRGKVLSSLRLGRRRR